MARGLKVAARVVAYAALAGTLAACGSDPKAPADAEPSTESAPSATPTESSGESGGLVDVGAHSLYADCPDEGTGPTVVFLHGLGGAGEDWLPTIGGLGDARTCWYDRLNVGRSDDDPARHSALDSVADLHALLAEVGDGGPYVLVGHSYGGLLAEMYAASYPGEVSGLVLADSTLTLETSLDPPSTVSAVRAEMNANGENLDAYEGYAQARQLEEKLPGIPVHYILAEEMDLPAEWSPKEYRRRVVAWVDSLPQGELVSCECDHRIPLNAPAVIAETIQTVIGAEAGAGTAGLYDVEDGSCTWTAAATARRRSSWSPARATRAATSKGSRTPWPRRRPRVPMTGRTWAAAASRRHRGPRRMS